MFETFRRDPGFTALEAVLTLALVATTLSVTTPPLQRALRQARLQGAVRGVHAVLVAARTQAIRRCQPVVVFVDSGRRRVTCWADEGPYNGLQDSDEPALANYDFPLSVSLRAPATGILIVFRPDGTSSPPPGAGLQALRPSTYTTDVPAGSVDCSSGCRGLFLADRAAGGNVFRVSGDDFGRSGRVSLLKWLPSSQGGNRGEIDFVPQPWKWAN